jgi:hypothetical protein
MPNTSPLSSPSYHTSRASSADGHTDLFDYSPDPFGFLPPSEDFNYGGLNVSILTQPVEDVLIKPMQTEPLDHYRLLEDAYNGLLHLFEKNESRLAQLTEENVVYKSCLVQLLEEHTGCKSRMDQLMAENVRLRYVVIIIHLPHVNDHSI